MEALGALMAATELLALVDRKISSAKVTTASKVALEKTIWAIPARTFPGNCLFHMCEMKAGQQSQVSSCLHKSLTSSLANSLGVLVRTRLKALSIAASGLGPKIFNISVFSNL